MAKLAELTFEKGQVDTALPATEATALLSELPGWTIAPGTPPEPHPELSRTFKFKDFVAAIAFANRVGELAETYNHHPALLVEYGSVKVSWWTHTAKGIAANDFLLARETTALIN